jgi:HEAT repeat protein
VHDVGMITRTTRLTAALAFMAVQASLIFAAGPSDPRRAEPELPPAMPYAQRIEQLKPLAEQQILTSARSTDPFLRSNALEAAQPLSTRLTPLLQLALDDAHPAVRFAALAIIGRQRLVDLAPAAARLTNDPVDSVKAAALFAQQACGRKVDVSPLAAMIASPEPSLRANVALLLGLMGDKSAAAMVRELTRQPLRKSNAAQIAVVHIQVAEALVQLGDDTALDAVRAGAYSQFDEVRVLAVQMMGRIGDRRMERAMVEMLKNPPLELQLAAAESLARLGHPDGLPMALKGAKSELATARVQAAITLGLFADARASDALAILLKDPEEPVRLAAAAAVLTKPTAENRRIGPRS